MNDDLESRVAQLEQIARVSQTVYYPSNKAPTVPTSTTTSITVQNPFAITHITAVTVASGNAGAVAWTTYDASASVPATARYAVVTCFGADEVGVGSDTYIKFRADSTAPELIGLYCFINAGVDDVSGTNTRIIPLTNLGFDYKLNLGFSNGWEILLEGYIL